MMRGIRAKDTKPELIVRQYLHARGFRYRLHPRKLPGKPDLVLPKYRAAIFVHGCFWHRHKNCRLAYNPKSREDFWQKKFAQNRWNEWAQTGILQLSNTIAQEPSLSIGIHEGIVYMYHGCEMVFSFCPRDRSDTLENIQEMKKLAYEIIAKKK